LARAGLGAKHFRVRQDGVDEVEDVPPASTHIHTHTYTHTYTCTYTYTYTKKHTRKADYIPLIHMHGLRRHGSKIYQKTTHACAYGHCSNCGMVGGAPSFSITHMTEICMSKPGIVKHQG
jgi:hypothetical protein